MLLELVVIKEIYAPINFADLNDPDKFQKDNMQHAL